MSNRFIRAEFAQERIIKLYIPQKQWILKAKVESCFVVSLHLETKWKRADHVESRRPGKGKSSGRENASTRKSRTSIVIFIEAHFHIKNTNKVIIFGLATDQISGVISISSVFYWRASLWIDSLMSVAMLSLLVSLTVKFSSRSF